MQISTMLRRGGARLSLLVVVPVLAAGAAGLQARDQEPDYRLVATVVVTPPSGASGGVLLSQAVEGFQSAMRTDAVVEEAAQAADVSSGVVDDSVSSRRLGTSEVVEVIYLGEQRPEARTLLEAQVKGAMNLLYGNELQAAQRQQADAKARFDAAAAAVAEVTEETGLVLPDEEYRAKSSEVSQLRIALVQAQSRGESTSAIESALDAATDELDEMKGQVASFEQPRFDLERTRTALSDADERLGRTRAGLEVSQSPDLVRVGQGSTEPQTAYLVRQVVAAAVIGLLVAIVLIALLELVSPRLRRRRGAGDAVTAAPVPGQTPRDVVPSGSEDARLSAAGDRR